MPHTIIVVFPDSRLHAVTMNHCDWLPYITDVTNHRPHLNFAIPNLEGRGRWTHVLTWELTSGVGHTGNVTPPGYLMRLHPVLIYISWIHLLFGLEIKTYLNQLPTKGGGSYCRWPWCYLCPTPAQQADRYAGGKQIAPLHTLHSL